MPIEKTSSEYNSLPYDYKRRQEYPDLSELADAIYWQQKGDNSKMEAWVAKCDIVKTKYPKPTE
jgi:hypothetical protein